MPASSTGSADAPFLSRGRGGIRGVVGAAPYILYALPKKPRHSERSDRRERSRRIFALSRLAIFCLARRSFDSPFGVAQDDASREGIATHLRCEDPSIPGLRPPLRMTQVSGSLILHFPRQKPYSFFILYLWKICLFFSPIYDKI